MRGNEIQGIPVVAIDISKAGMTNAGRILQHLCESKLQISWGAANNVEHLRGRSLLLQRLSEVGGALA